jgi:hypothetical protein
MSERAGSSVIKEPGPAVRRPGAHPGLAHASGHTSPIVTGAGLGLHDYGNIAVLGRLVAQLVILKSQAAGT